MGRKSSAIGFALYTDLLEQLQKSPADYDVDTVLLHDCADDGLMAAAQALAEAGSVLVCTAIPQHKRWRRLLKYENGEVLTLENNG